MVLNKLTSSTLNQRRLCIPSKFLVLQLVDSYRGPRPMPYVPTSSMLTVGVYPLVMFEVRQVNFGCLYTILTLGVFLQMVSQ